MINCQAVQNILKNTATNDEKRLIVVWSILFK